MSEHTNVSVQVASYENLYSGLHRDLFHRISSLVCHNYKNFYCSTHELDWTEIRDFDLRTLSVIIPVKGRPDHLHQCLKSLSRCLELFTPEQKDLVRIVVAEMDSELQFKGVVSEYGEQFNYIGIGNESAFNKSYCMNIAAGYAPSDFYLFLDVDIVTSSDWLMDVMQHLYAFTQRGEPNVFLQAVPERKVLYVDRENTEKIFSGALDAAATESIPYSVNPNWPQAAPPGGAVCVSAPLFYAVGGFDPFVMWGYSPEDRFFLKNCLHLNGDKFANISGKAKFFHLDHPKGEQAGISQNLETEYMVFMESLIDNVPELRWEYIAMKHYYGEQIMKVSWWRKAKAKSGEDRFTDLSNIFFTDGSTESDIQPPDCHLLQQLLMSVNQSRIDGAERARD